MNDLKSIDKIKIENGTILNCELIETGTFALRQDLLHAEGTITGLPPFYRIQVNLKPTSSSNINVELWLPLPENWNGRFMGTGNGGGGGIIYYYPLRYGLLRGFATANTDLGTAPDVEALVNNPERQKDFGNRATHVMAEAAKSIIEQFYKKAASYSYFVGGSTGGQQGLVEAQRYPDDFDGIIAGAPGSNRTHLHAQFIWDLQATNTEDGSLMFTMEELNRITDAVVKKYAEQSGGAPGDSFLTDPRGIIIEPEFLKELDLSEKQIEALMKVYAGPVNPRTGKRIFSGVVPGTEGHMGGLFLGQNPAAWLGIVAYPFIWALGDEFNYKTFDFDKDMDAVDKKVAAIVNANNPDLSAFRQSGRKMILYTGTTDTQVSCYDTISYYERIVKQEGSLEKAQEFVKLYVVPGLGHMQAGPGLNDIGQVVSSPDVPLDAEHNILTALMEWVENGHAPEKIIATGYHSVDPFCGEGRDIRFQRPVYPYPLFPKYIGGNVDAPDSYCSEEHMWGTAVSSDDEYLQR
jgi:feruloyl esterase